MMHGRKNIKKVILMFVNCLYTLFDHILYAHGRHTICKIGLMMVARATETRCH